jgi:hypothetical protein
MIDFLQHQERSQLVGSSPKKFLTYPSGFPVPSANMQLSEIAESLELLIVSPTIAVAAPIPQGTSVRAGYDGRINFTSN